MKGEKKVGVASGLQSGALGLEGDGIALEVARRAGDERVQVGSVHTRVGCLAARARSGANPTRVIAADAKPVWRGGNLDKATRRHWPAFHPRREIHGAAAAQAECKPRPPALKGTSPFASPPIAFSRQQCRKAGWRNASPRQVKRARCPLPEVPRGSLPRKVYGSFAVSASHRATGSQQVVVKDCGAGELRKARML